MKKKVMTGLIGAMLISSAAFASPSVPLQQGETQIGFDTANMSTSVSALGQKADLGDINNNSFYLQHGLSDKVTLGVEHTKLDSYSNGLLNASIKATDVYGQYKLNNNFSLIAGNRNYDASAGISSIYNTGVSESQFLYGVTGSTKLSDKLTGFASFKKTSMENEYQVGVADQLSKNVGVNVSYKNHDYNFGAVGLNTSGVGVGVNYKF